MLNKKEIVITDIVRILHPEGTGYGHSWTQEGGLPTHEIIIRLSGESDSKFDNVILHTKPGSIKYLPKGQGGIAHENIYDTGACINIFFHADAQLSDKPFVYQCTNFDEFKRLFEKAEHIWLKKDAGYKYEAISVLYRILALLQKEQLEQSQRCPEYEKIRGAVEYINLNFRSGEIDLEHVASFCNMSYSYFRRLFTRCMGISPAKYIVEKKIEYAKDMLMTHQYSISEVSDAVGFKDIYYFSHVFKKMTGTAPSQFDGI